MASEIVDHPPTDPRAPIAAGPVARVALSGSIVVALVVSCCVAAPPVLLVAAHLTLSAAAGLAVGMLVVVGTCMLHAIRRSHACRRQALRLSAPPRCRRPS